MNKLAIISSISVTFLLFSSLNVYAETQEWSKGKQGGVFWAEQQPAEEGKDCRPPQPAHKPRKDPLDKRTTISVPTNKESCELLGGWWGTIGRMRVEICNLPTSDAGKECSDSDECEGYCIAELSREDWDKAIHGVIYSKGKCTAWISISGCPYLFVH